MDTLTLQQVLQAHTVTTGDPGGSKRAAFRKALHAAVQGECATCGTLTTLDGNRDSDDYANIGHVRGGVQGSKSNIRPGCVFLQCRSCNMAQGDLGLIETGDVQALVNVGACPAVIDIRAVAHSIHTREDRSAQRAARGMSF